MGSNNTQYNTETQNKVESKTYKEGNKHKTNKFKNLKMN
jgi:hypothetical protein